MSMHTYKFSLGFQKTTQIKPNLISSKGNKQKRGDESQIKAKHMILQTLDSQCLISRI